MSVLVRCTGFEKTIAETTYSLRLGHRSAPESYRACVTLLTRTVRTGKYANAATISEVP